MQTLQKQTLPVRKWQRSDARPVALRSPVEAVWWVREGSGRERPVNRVRARGLQSQQRRSRERALARQLARVTARLEQTRAFRTSLQRALELGRELQATLEPAQRERWLALEDALLEHCSRLYESYFRAGMEYGEQRAGRAVGQGRAVKQGRAVEQRRRGETPQVSARKHQMETLERQALLALSLWLAELARD